jgi:phytanoyl-CoA dioxygenase PhyH
MDPDMDRLLSMFARRRALPAVAAEELAACGFTVLPGPIAQADIPRLQAAYDAACASADAADVGVGRASTRVNDFVNRGAVFDAVYTWPPALEASWRVIRRPFRLSAMHARTLRPGATAQELHVDVPRTSDAWPMVGLILMVDEFRADNGATRFVPGSHRWTELPEQVMADRLVRHPAEVLAEGPAGSVILFDASTWHGHTANGSTAARRSLQATFIPREGKPATDFGGRMSPETRARIGAVRRYLLGIEQAIDRSPDDEPAAAER